MKINVGLYLGVSPSAGGMFQYAQSLVSAVKNLDSDYNVTIVYSDIEWKSVLNRLEIDGLRIKHGRLGEFISNIFMFLKLSRFISQKLGMLLNPLIWELNKFECDIWVFPAQESISYQMPTKTIGTIHDLMHRYEPSFPEVSSLGRYSIREHRFSNIAKSCDAVLVDSIVGRNHVVESYGVDEGRVGVLPYIAPSFIFQKQDLLSFDSRYSLPKKFIFYPAQFWPHKNHLRLLEAMKIAMNKSPDVSLVLSGGFNHSYLALRNKVAELDLSDCVHFVGYVPDNDLRCFYERARALIMPTFFGPTNIPPLEALAVGCPALVSNIYGMPEQLGDAALYFNPLNSTEMADSISRIWNDDILVESLSKMGLQRTKQFGQAVFNDRFSKILNKVAINAKNVN